MPHDPIFKSYFHVKLPPKYPVGLSVTSVETEAVAAVTKNAKRWTDQFVFRATISS